MATALGLISGVAPPALFLSFTDPQTADLIGTVLLFSITAAFMLGLWLRLTSLMLAIFVFATSVVQNLVLADTPLVEPFWRDLALVGAVLLNYTGLKQSESRPAALVWRRSTPRLRNDQVVVPRRVTSGTTAADRAQERARTTPAMQPLTSTRPAPTQPAMERPKPRLVSATHGDIGEVENIFAAL
ncbi:hypothetical protein [Roseovarius atlanticus]|uniref:hypothetical protein n=1 Tax=Roseovarius atlanticus TaxID=1641875 RepID=UPI001C974015|nr:hypothetical protein [Roseovarius atlanticus]MBY5988850.1 hypothetical protein [Roseovarius atlanticus]MBY6124241.1 hypothetical protein [Roseovarius atlanticus]MBY6148736.1 hypothetical protein [Roseovarius atlanticus]